MRIPLAFLLERMNISFPVEKIPVTVFIQRIYLFTGEEKTIKADSLYIGSDCPEITTWPESSYFLAAGKSETEKENPHMLAASCSSREELFNRALDVCYEFAVWDQKFCEYLKMHAELTSIVYHCSQIMGNPVYVVDQTFKVVAIDDTPIYSDISSIWKHLVKERYVPYDIVYNLQKSRELEEMRAYQEAVVYHSEYFNNQFINFNLMKNGNIRGHFFVVGYCKAITKGDLAAADYIGNMLTKYIVTEDQYNRVLKKDYEHFFVHLITNTIHDENQIRRQIQPWKWKIDDTYFMLTFCEKRGILTLNDVLSNKIEMVFGCRSIIWKENIIALFCMKDYKQDWKTLLKELKKFFSDHQCIGGISDCFDNLCMAETYYRQSFCAMEHAKQGMREPICIYKTIFFEDFLEQCKSNVNFSGFIDRRVKRIRDYDAENGTEYLNTLKEYLQNECKLYQTSEKLHIHRNTLAYRLERIRLFLGTDFEEVSDRQRLLFTISVMKIAPDALK